MSAEKSKKFGGQWSDEKLAALRDYLSAYMTAMKKTPFKLGYIDAFAGAVMFWMVHASDYIRAPSLMHSAYRRIGAGGGLIDPFSQSQMGFLDEI